MLLNASISVLREVEYSGSATRRDIPISVTIKNKVINNLVSTGLIIEIKKTIYITDLGVMFLKFIDQHSI